MYCTINDILLDLPKEETINLINDEKRKIKTDDEEDGVDLEDSEDIATARLLLVIEDTEEEINGYLRSVYTIPLVSIPKRLNKLARIITIYNLFKRRFPIETPYKKEYDNVIIELEKIQSGTIDLGISQSEDYSFLTNENEQDFTEEVLNKY